jgi:alpha-D-ribose 1-methylphosphonate 5-triphosphate synthase subunit PhnH
MTARNDIPTLAAPGLSLAGLCAGFSDTGLQSQQVFRRVLAALSEPGTLHDLPEGNAPDGLHIASYQVCLALLDAETPLWIEPSLKTQAIVNALRFHCGCPVVNTPEQAEFALVTPDFEGDLACFALGSHEYPDRSTTLIVQVDNLDEAGQWTLSGPGISDRRSVGVTGLNARWSDMITDNRALFPCGVDLLFTAGPRLMGLPRTTKVEV